MTYRFPIGATDLPVFEPGSSVTEPWGNNDRWVYLAAQVNRFIEKGKLSWRWVPLPLEGAQMVFVSGFPWFVMGPSLELAKSALRLYQARVAESGYGPDIAAVNLAMTDDSAAVRYVAKYVAMITSALRAQADALGLPPARGVAKTFPWMLVGAGALAVVLVSKSKKGRRR